ncbi:MAG: glycerophosphodiester phosphodiesterase family protein [Bacteroidota bacterium]
MRRSSSSPLGTEAATVAGRLAPLALVVLLAACGSPRPVAPEAEIRRVEEIARPTSSVHYRDWDTAADLAAAFRYTPDAQPLISAHRGGPMPGLPENSLEAFENALNHAPALIEMDVRQTADGRLILLHDETLDRTTTGSGEVSEATFRAIRQLRLVDEEGTITSYRVPTLAEALAWAEGRAVLMLDVKRGVPMADVMAEVRAMGGGDQAALIVYTLEAALEAARLAPEMMISVSATSAQEAREVLASDLAPDQLIAFGGVGRFDAEAIRLLHGAGIRVQVGTFGETDRAAQAPGGWAVYTPFLEAGVDVLATDNVPVAAIATRAPRR